METKIKRQIQRKRRVKAKIFGTKARPRLSVYRSNKFLYAQIINDEEGKTLAAAKGLKTDGEKIGGELAKKAVTKKLKKVIFDRNGFKYHGKVKALAEGARKGGLEF